MLDRREAELRESLRRFLDRARERPQAAAADVIDLVFGFTSGEEGAELSSTQPPVGLQVDFPCELLAVYVEEISDPPIAGTATVDFDVRSPAGAWESLRGATAPGFSGTTSGSDTALAGWLRYLQPGDRVRARLTAATTVESVQAILRARKLGPAVNGTLGLYAGGDTLIDGSGNSLVVRR